MYFPPYYSNLPLFPAIPARSTFLHKTCRYFPHFISWQIKTLNVKPKTNF